MKTIYAKFFVFFLLLTSMHSQIFSAKDKKSFHMNIEPIFSYSNGTLNETIYRSADKAKKISLLEWERKFFMYGVNINAEYKNFFIDFGLLTSFRNVKSGEMRDSDWQNPSDYNMKTTYSVGANYAEENYDASISMGYKIKPVKNFFIAPKIQFQYMYDSFYRKKGAEGWYGQAESKFGSLDGKYHWWYEKEARKYPYMDPETGKTWTLAGIDYERQSLFAWAGFSTSAKIYNFSASVDLLCSPFTYFYAEDRHHTGTSENNVYHEIQYDFFSSYKISLGLNYEISRFFTINFGTDFLISKNIKGDLYIDWAKLENQSSGASFKTENIKLGCKIMIF